MGIGNGTLPDENSTSVEIGASYDAVPADSLKGATLSARMGRVLALQDFRNVEVRNKYNSRWKSIPSYLPSANE